MAAPQANIYNLRSRLHKRATGEKRVATTKRRPQGLKGSPRYKTAKTRKRPVSNGERGANSHKRQRAARRRKTTSNSQSTSGSSQSQGRRSTLSDREPEMLRSLVGVDGEDYSIPNASDCDESWTVQETEDCVVCPMHHDLNHLRLDEARHSTTQGLYVDDTGLEPRTNGKRVVHDREQDFRKEQVSCFEEDYYASLLEEEVLFRLPITDLARSCQWQSLRRHRVEWLISTAEQFAPDVVFTMVHLLDLASTMDLEAEEPTLMLTIVYVSAKYYRAIHSMDKLFEALCPPRFIQRKTDCDDLRRSIVALEMALVTHRSFRLRVPTIDTFLSYFSKVDFVGGEDRARHLCYYLGELSLTDADCSSRYLPSVIAGSILFVVRQVFCSPHVWPELLTKQTGYYPQLFNRCVTRIVGLWQHVSPTSPVFRKYCMPEHFAVARMRCVSGKVLNSWVVYQH